MSEYDKRQYASMLEQIKQFEAKQIDLKHLISGLESLLCLLEEVNVERKGAFQSRWGVLEEVYADMLDHGYKDLPEASQKLVGKSVRDLRAMVEVVLHPNSQ